ncbi:recombination protein O N-terminal domain-containing protein [Candidatus Hydrogenosomobacter endosymbioticus]|uniref:recombination protein O N-terminal domain-containing protein n=1 Tax=Candidatus Hydrogenosomobacter endosymbioticus TaxID=2558174 RepID=UPI001F3FF989|nr:recombination protein O N-terminal domain-containing protein [Candidatus Hydrogenosomobacter endosymbioticus]
MRWKDGGIVIGSKNFGENKQIVSILTKDHGLYSGMLHGSARKIGHFFCGTFVFAAWSARLEEQLGVWTIDGLDNTHIVRALDHRLSLQTVTTSCFLVKELLPERNQCESVFVCLSRLVIYASNATAMNRNEAVKRLIIGYARLENSILYELGYPNPAVTKFLLECDAHSNPNVIKSTLLLLNKTNSLFERHWPNKFSLQNARKSFIETIGKEAAKI